MSASTTAPETLAGLKTLESQLADEAAAKALALHHVRGLIAALEAPADGPEPETEAGRTPRSMSVCAAGGSHVHVHVSGGPRPRSPSPDAHPRETSEERWLRKALEKKRAESKLEFVKHEEDVRHAKATKIITELRYGRGRSGGRYYGEDREPRRSRSRSRSRSRGRRRRRSRSRSEEFGRIPGESDADYEAFCWDHVRNIRNDRNIREHQEFLGKAQGHFIRRKETYGDCSEGAALLRREERLRERRDRRCAPVPEAVESESEEQEQEGRRKRRRAPAREAAESESEEEEEAPPARRSPRLRGEPAPKPAPQLSSSAKRG